MPEPSSPDIIGNSDQLKGIPNSEIVMDSTSVTRRIAKGLSGREVIIDSSPDKIELTEGKYKFKAYLTKNGLVNFTILNEIEGQRSENLFPRQLIELVLNKWKTKIKGIAVAWYPDGGTNITQFNDAKKRGGSDEEALFSTWTGKIARENGFTKVTEFAQEDGLVVANFMLTD